MSTGRSILLLLVLASLGGFCLVCLGEGNERLPRTATGELVAAAPAVAGTHTTQYQREALGEPLAALEIEPASQAVLPLEESMDESPPGEALPQGTATIEGVVRDARGEPIEDAHVWAFAADAPSDADLIEVRTDDHGGYELAITDAPRRRLFVAGQMEPLQADVAGPFDVRIGERRHLDLTLAAAPVIHGVVVDAWSEQPVAGASVELASKLAGFGDGSRTTTGADGSFTLASTGLPAVGLLVHVLGDATHGCAQVELTSPECVLVRVGAPVDVEGVVVDAVSQAPLFNVPVRLVGAGADPLDGAAQDEAFTARDGSFAIGLRRVTFEAAVLVVAAPHHELLRVALADVARGIRGSDRHFTVRLPLRPR